MSQLETELMKQYYHSSLSQVVMILNSMGLSIQTIPSGNIYDMVASMIQVFAKNPFIYTWPPSRYRDSNNVTYMRANSGSLIIIFVNGLADFNECRHHKKPSVHSVSAQI
jgi:hypothetical protein